MNPKPHARNTSAHFHPLNQFKFIPAAFGLLLAGLTCAHAADRTWDFGAGTQAWNTLVNWSGDAFTSGGDNAIVNTITAGQFPIFTVAGLVPVDVRVGNGSGTSGRLDLRTGTLSLNNTGTSGNWCMVGANASTGTLNIADTSAAGGGISSFAQGSGSLTVGKLWIGGAAFSDNGTGTVNINTTGTITANSTGSGYSASVIVGSYLSAANGTLKLESGTVQANAEAWIGNAGTGTVTQSGGIFNSTSYFVIARGDGGGLGAGTGTYNLTGGTVNAATASGVTTMASTRGGSGTLNVSGGTFNSTLGGILVAEAFFGSGQPGGGSVTGTATGTLNLSGTGVVNTGTGTANGIYLGVNANSAGTVNLNGGTLQTAIVKQGSGTGTNNFNGGTLKATAANTAFMTGLTRANVRNGGAIIDNNTFDITIGQALEHSNIGGDAAADGGLTKNSAGMLTLSGANTFTGDVNVNNGRLAANRSNNNLNPTSSALGNPQVSHNINVNNGGTLQFLQGDTLGGANSAVVATLVVNSGGVVTNVNNNFNTFGPVQLNGGTITGGGGAIAGYQMYNLRGTVTVGGSAMSTISGTGTFPGYHLAAPTTFNVADATSGTDLLITGILIDRNATDGGSGALTKTGPGTLTLSGGNTYTGNTTINGGTLQLSGSGSINSSTNIIVSSGATFDVSAIAYSLAAGQTLKGGGVVTGNVAMASSTAFISPGTSAGTLTFTNDLNLASGSATLEVSTSASSGNDQIVVGGNLTLNSSTTLHVSALNGASALDTTANYVLIAVSGTTTMASTPALVWDGTTPANYLNFSIQKVGQNVVLQYTAATAPTVTASTDVATATRNQAVKFTAVVTPGSGGIASVTANLTDIGGASGASLVLSNNNTYTNTFTVGSSTTTGAKNLTVTVTDNTTPTPLAGNTSVALTIVAANQTWDGGSATDDNWSSNPNWSGDSGPGLIGDAVTFAGTTRLTPNMDNTFSVTSVTFDNTAGSFNISSSTSSTLTNSGDIVNNSSSAQTLNVPMVLSASQTLDAAAGNLTLAGAVTNNTTLLTATGAANTTVSGAVAGSSSLLKTGAGSVTFGNGSSWTGGAAIGNIPANSGFPLVAREGTTLFNGGTHNVTGEAVIGGVVADGGAGQNARIQVDSGTLAVSSYLSLGRGNGVGAVSSDLVANNAAAITAANFSAGYNGGSSLNLPKGSIALNGTSSLTVASNGVFLLAESTGSDMSMTLSNSAQLVVRGTGTHKIGAGGAGVLYINDSSSVTIGDNGGGTSVGSVSGSGTVNMTGGTFSVGGTGSGIIAIANSTAANNSVTGTVNVSGGTVNCSGDLVVGLGGVNTGTMTMSGSSTVNVGTSALRWLIVGQFDTVRGTLNINGGDLKLWNSTSVKFTPNGNTSTNSINQNGGTVTFYGDNATTVGGTGDLNLAQAGGSTTLNTYNLNGGTLTVPSIASASTTPTRIFNFNSGTLKPAASTATFFNLGTGSARANVRDGGAIIDTDGKNITIAQALLHSNVGGDNAADGGLTKSSTGTLTLTSANTYTGPTAIDNGTLALSGSGSIANSASISVGSSATFDVSAISYTLSAGQTLKGYGVVTGNVATANSSSITPGTSVGTITFTNNLDMSSGGSATFDLSTSAGSGNDQIVVGGNLALSSSATIHLSALSGSSDLDTSASYVLFAVAGTTTGTLPSLVWDGTKPGNWQNFSISTSGNNVVLLYTPVVPIAISSASAMPSTLTRNQATTIAVTVSPGTGGGITVTADLSQIGGPSSTNLVLSDTANVYTNTVRVSAGTSAGSKTITVTASDNTPSSANYNITPVVVTVANDVWGGGGADNDFTSHANWTNNAAPGLLGDSLMFAGTTRLTPNMNNNYSVTGVTFDSTAGSFNIGSGTGSTLTNGSGGIVNNSASAQTLSVPVVMSAAQTINAASGNLTLGSTVNAGGTTLTVNGAADTSISGTVSGANGLTKNGNGTLSLAANNSFSGTMSVNAGAVSITAGSNNVPGVSVVNHTSGSSAGTINISGGGVLNSTGYTVAFDGQSASAAGAGTLNVTNGTLSSENDLLLAFAGSGTGTLNVGSGAVVNVASTTLRWLIMNYWDTTRGNLNVNGGTVNLNANSAIRFSVGWYGPGASVGQSAVTLNGGAINGGSTSVIDLNNNADNAVDNTLNLNGGTLTIGQIISGKANGSRVVNFNGGTLKAAGASASFFASGAASAANVRTNGAIIDTDGNDITIGQALVHLDPATDGGLTKNGNGTLMLTGASTYNGATAVNAGTLLVHGSIGSGAVTVASGATFGGNGTVGGAATINGTLSPGASIGTLTLGASPTLAGTTLMEINTTNSPATNDRLVVNAALAYGGTLTVTNTGDALAGGEVFDLFDATSFSGAFSATNLPSLSGSLNWYLGDLTVDGKIYVNRPPNNSDKSYTRNAGTSLHILKSDLLAGATDPDSGDSLGFDALTSAGSQGATITETATELYYEPANNNPDTLQFRIKDARGGVKVNNITIAVDNSGAGGAAQNITPTMAGMQVTFAGIPTLKYDVQRAEDVDFSVNLTTMTTTNAPSNGIFTITDPAPPSPTGYYRLKFNPN